MIKDLSVASDEVVIDAPVEKVWAILVDFENYGAWNTFCPSIKNRALAIGEAVEMMVDLGEGPSPQVEYISRIDPLECIAWSMEKLLQSPDCGAVLGWPPGMTVTGGRRLQLAAESGNSIGFTLCRDAPEAAGQRTGASLCLRLWRQDSSGPLCLRILKMRGACHRGELILVL